MLPTSTVAWSIFSALALMAVAGLISANVRVWASKHGFDQWLLRFSEHVPSVVQKMVAGWEPLRRRWWLWLAMGLSGGLAAALSMNPTTRIPLASPISVPSSPPSAASASQPVTKEEAPSSFPVSVIPSNHQQPAREVERHVSVENAKIFQDVVNAAMLVLPADRSITINIETEGGCMECEDYASSLISMVKNTPHLELLNSHGVVMGPSIRNTGINIYISDDPSPGVTSVVAAFTAADIAFDLQKRARSTNPTIFSERGEIELIVIHPQ